ncbi:MAG TPA: AMP-binding protein [Rhizomicrobium sp.]
MRMLGDLFQLGLRAAPRSDALVSPQRRYCFAELESMSDFLAGRLRREFAVLPGDRVAIVASKAPEIVIAAVAIWKCGAIYAPLDTADGVDRLGGMLQSLEPRLVISSAENLTRHVLPRGLAGLSYEEIAQLDAAGEPFRHRAPSDATAIIIHTSGSTGRPKGVQLSHGSVVAYFLNHNRFLQFAPGARSLNNGPFHFDVSIQDTFLPLFFGATVVMHADVFLSSLITSLLRRQRITHLIAVSSVLQLISSGPGAIESLHNSDLRLVQTGGETCDPKLMNRWMTGLPGLRMLYGYGPTEANSICMAYEVLAPEPLRASPYPVGRPFPGHSAVLLGDDLQTEVAAGDTGVLAVSGPQLMSGYWRDEVETAASMVLIGGAEFYITGDRFRIDDDGNYCFVGRRDAEVKIRGRRINLNEIRNALLQQPSVNYAVLHVVEVGGEQQIAAIAHGHDVIDLQELRSGVKKLLPSYMVPTYLAASHELILTSTRKANDRAMISLLSQAITREPRRYNFSIGSEIAQAKT